MSHSIKTKRSKITSITQKQSLSKKAKRYDQIVRTLLSTEDRDKDSNQVLIFNHQEGFINTDLNNFGKYSIRLY